MEDIIPNNNHITEHIQNNIKINQYSNELNTLLEMGFDKEKALEAIKFAKGKIELAIDFLYNGFPLNLSNISGENNNGSMDQNIGDDEDEYGEDFEDISFLLKKITSIIKLLSSEIKKTPDELLEMLKINKNKLYKFIEENIDEYNNLLKENISNNDIEIFKKFKQGIEKIDPYNLQYKDFIIIDKENNIINDNNKNKLFFSDEEEFFGKEDEGAGSEQEVELDLGNKNGEMTDNEKEIIGRLKELGNFSENDVIQSFLLCDKNEEVTANYLFEHFINK